MNKWSEHNRVNILLILILLTAAFFRFYALDQVPPGLTHDEANNVHDAASIIAGERPFYFPVAQGKEPLYIYSAGGLMALVGKTPWVLRLTSAIWGMGLIIITFAWVRRAFDTTVALATVAGLAVCFWPVTSARLGLRAITLPVLFALFAYLLWLVIDKPDNEKKQLEETDNKTKKSLYFRVILNGVALGLCLYTYLASRLVFIIVVPFFIYLGFFHRTVWTRTWKQNLIIIGIALLVMAPMILYLEQHPSAEIRINQLDNTLRLLFEGDISPLLENVRQAIRLFSFKGDTFVPYNIPGKPLLEPLIGLLFYAGLGVALWQWKRPACMFALLWFIVGMIPALVTGREASNLRLYLIQPVVFLFPALAFGQIWDWFGAVTRRDPQKRWGHFALAFVVLALFVYGSFLTFGDYFNRWAKDSDARVHYHVDLIEIGRIAERYPGVDVGISATYPGEYHDPRVVEAVLGQEDSRLRWFDGKESLVVPFGETSILIVPDRTQLSLSVIDSMDVHLRLIETVSMLSDDFVKNFSIYQLNDEKRDIAGQVMLGEQLTLNSARLSCDKVDPGQTVELITEWTIIDKLTDERDAKFFVHLLDRDGNLIIQDDRLGAPSWNWHPGDRLYQIFQLALPEKMSAGRYRLVLGMYTTADRVDTVFAGREPDSEMIRLPVFIDSVPVGDSIELETEMVVGGD